MTKGGAAIPVRQVTSGPVKAGPAIPVYGYTGTPSDRPGAAGPAKPVKVLTAADLRQNGGAYVVAGDAQAMPVYDAPAGAPVAGEAAIPVYPVNDWPVLIPPVLPDRLSANATSALGTPAVSCTLQTGHNWTSTRNSNGDMNYAAEHYQGTQCIKMTTQGDGTTTKVTSPRLTAMDMRANMLRVWIKPDAASYAYLNSVAIFFGGGASAFAWSAFTTKGIFGAADLDSTTIKADDGWLGFTIGVNSLTNISGSPDWSQVRDWQVQIQDTNTGGNKATLYVGGIEFIANHASYPHGVVSFAFDDGYDAVFTEAKTKLDTYGYTGTAFIVKQDLDTGSFLTSAHVAALAAGGWDVCSHCFYSADHGTGFAVMTDANIANDLGQMDAWLKGNGYGPRQMWATPKGYYTNHVINLVKANWFSSHRLAVTRSIETMPVGNPYRLLSMLPINTTAVTPDSTAGTLEWYVAQTYANGGWLIFSFHNLVASPSVSTEYSIANFGTLVDYIHTLGIPVQKMSKVLYG